MNEGRNIIRDTRIIVHIASVSNWSKVVLTNTIIQVDKFGGLTREYSTYIGNIVSVCRRRIRGARRIVHIISF